MNRDRPLWEYWFCEGLADGRWALLSKLHHSLVDGVSGTDLYQLVLDPTRTPRAAVPDAWEPADPPSTLTLTARAAWDLATSPMPATRAATETLAAPVGWSSASADDLRGLLAMSSAPAPGAVTSLTGPLEGSRRYAWTDVSLADIRTVRKRYGVTVNDVALAAVTGGFRLLLMSRGEEPDAHTLRSLVPGLDPRARRRVDPRQPGLPDAALPAGRPRRPGRPAPGGPGAGARAARAARAGGRREPHHGGGLGPFGPVSWGIRFGLRLPQRQIATVTTNVPGPRMPLYALGREALEMLPYVPIADRVRVGVAMFSYRDTLTFGITGDYDTTPDLQVLADGVAASMAELLGLARAAG